MTKSTDQSDHDACAIIRSAGERTEEACRLALARALGDDNVIVIHERPFARAVSKSFTLGINAGKRWTLCVDADVILTPESIVTMLQDAAEQPDTTFIHEFMTLDRFSGIPAPRGAYIYRTALLEIGLRHVPDPERTARPGGMVSRCMRNLGYASHTSSRLVGVHEYEQYYRDIIAKRYFRAQKCGYEIPYLLKRSLENTWEGKEAEAMLLGIACSLQHKNELLLDATKHQDLAADVLEQQGWTERSALDAEQITSHIATIIDAYAPSPVSAELMRYREDRAAISDVKLQQATTIGRWVERLKESRLTGRPVVGLGRFLARIGKRLSN